MRGESADCGTQRRGVRRGWLALVVGGLTVTLLVVTGASAGRPAAPFTPFTLDVVVHGQGRVQSVPAGTIDCPSQCSATFLTTTTVTLHATPSAGHAIGAWFGGCGETQADCTVTVGPLGLSVDVYFRPSAELELLPVGHGAITVSPPGTDSLGEPADPTCQALASSLDPCRLYYVPNTTVSAVAAPASGSTFLGWSRFTCPGTDPCNVTLEGEQTSLAARFSPLPVNVIKGGNGTGTVVSDPAGVNCPGTCSNVEFPTGTTLTLIATPDHNFPFLRWIFGCVPSPTDPRRCTVTVTNFPQWIGVAVGADDDIAPPTTVDVVFGVSRVGKGSVTGNRLDCGQSCENRYGFGQVESLLAHPAQGWRLKTWRGACQTAPSCVVNVGPVTSIQAVFAENLAPRLLRVSTSGKHRKRRIAVRLRVAHSARARLSLRRIGAGKLTSTRRFALKAGQNALVLTVPVRAKPGKYRLTIAVSDASGGGRTYRRTLRLGR